MARTRSISSIETEISKVTADLQKAQEKVDELSQRLLALQEMKQSIEAKQIVDAFRKSGKSMQGGNPKFCVNTICGANRAKFIQGGSRENPAAAFSTT